MFLAYTIPVSAGLVLLVAENVCGQDTEQHSQSNVAVEAKERIADHTDRAISNGLAWLFEQQAEDGGWHSEYYGALRGGAATTSLALYALGHCAENELTENIEPHRTAINRARDFLLRQIDTHGYVTNADGPDYANYASAMLLLADAKLSLKLPEKTRLRLRDYLIAAQLNETHQYQPGDIDYGGWDLTGWAQSPRKSAGTNVSVSAYALEALALFDDDETSRCRERAKAWLATCRADDGGYYFHPRKDHDGNKAGWHDGSDRQQPRSYGTATCDGLRCMIALGMVTEPLETRVTETLDWIGNHLVTGDVPVVPDKLPLMTGEVPGFEDEKTDVGWRTGLQFYYLASLSQVLPQTAQEQRRQTATQISRLLLEKQAPAGFWQNPNARMREDDPLISTPLTLISLASIRRELSN